MLIESSASAAAVSYSANEAIEKNRDEYNQTADSYEKWC
jgi:hypothetical protein